MYGKTHVWLLPGWFSADWWRTVDKSDGCSQADLQLALQGFLSTDILPLSGSEDETISGYVSFEERETEEDLSYVL